MFKETTSSLFKGNLVRLSACTPEDAETMASWTEDADYLRNVDTDMAVPSSSDALSSNNGRKQNGVEFRLRTLAENRLVGFVALHGIEWNNQCALLAIGIGERTARNQGYGSDGLRLILRYGFHELNLNRIGLDVISYNARAIHVYEKAGFKEEGKLREGVLRDGKKYDRILMGILRSEWEN